MNNWIRRVVLVLFCSVMLLGCAYGRYMKKGDDAFAAGDYEQALVQYEAAAEKDPKSLEAIEKIKQTKEQLVAENGEQARAALENGDLLGAMVAANKAWKRLPDAPPTQAIVQDVSNATFAKAQQLTDAKDFANALVLYETLSETLPSEAEKAQPHAEEVKQKWGAMLEERAAAATAAGRKGDALLSWAKLAQLSRDPAHGGKRDTLRNELLTEYAYWVQLSGSGRAAYENLVAGLSGVSEGTALRVAEKLPTGVSPAVKAKFKLGNPKFRTETSTRTETVQYQSGTQQVPNPFYKSKQDKVLEEERRLVDDQNDVTDLENDVMRYEEAVAKEGDTPNVSTGAEQNLSNAKSRLESARRSVQDQRNAVQRAKEELAREPQTKEEPVYSNHSFSIVTHTLLGEMKFDANLTHPDGRAPIAKKDVATVTASDDTHPAQDVAGVREDPLNLPSQAALSVELYDKALTQARALVGQSFTDWRATLVERAMAAASDDERVDMMVIYIVTNPADVTPKVPADLSALRGIPDAVRVLTP